MNTEASVYHFEQGIPGFEHLQKFVFEQLDEEIPMLLLKSVDEPEISMIVNPFVFFPNYEWELSESAKQELSIETENQLGIWSVVTIAESSAQATVNLLAPIVVNHELKLGKQLILHNSPYSARTPIIQE
jgi:flagellar assembly factor FliW